MSSHVHHEIFLHFNWHTKYDRPILNGALEASAHAELKTKCLRIKGAHWIECGGTDDHVHVVLQIEPFVTISKLVGELKGGSSFEVNKLRSRKELEWQRGYSAVSFGKRNLEWVLGYVRRQREHHASGRVFERLERYQPDEDDDQAESPAEAG